MGLRESRRRSPVPVAAWLICCLAAAGHATPDVRESFDLQVPLAPSPVSLGGEFQLVYELHLTNLSGDALAVSKVAVVDADGRRIAAFEGDELRRRFARFGADGGGDALTLRPGARAVLYVELGFDAAPAPQHIRHRVDYAVAEDLSTEFVVAGGRTNVDEESLPVLGAPLRGGPWAAVYSPVWERGHRRVFYTVDGRARLPGRFAIDWFRLDEQGRFGPAAEESVEAAYGYGAEVLAVQEATVAAARDGVAEGGNGARRQLIDAAGNYVVLELGDGRYAFYEHLKPGSVRVQPGERVRRGQVIAEVGSTGSSRRAHLHFHVADGMSPLGAEGLPFLLEGFRLLGHYDDSLEGLGRRPWMRLDDPAQRERLRERPAPNAVVEFPGRRVASPSL